jgi:hypothetical protein
VVGGESRLDGERGPLWPPLTSQRIAPTKHRHPLRDLPPRRLALLAKSIPTVASFVLQRGAILCQTHDISGRRRGTLCLDGKSRSEKRGNLSFHTLAVET